MTITTLLKQREYIIADGAMGTMLQQRGLKPGHNPMTMNITAPETVESVHRMYIEAGSDIICANTFMANRLNLKGTPYSPQQVITAAVKSARRATELNREVLVALDAGPTGHMLEPLGELSFDDAYKIYKEMAVFGEEAGADFVTIETMSDTEELRAAITAVKENTNLQVFATMTFEQSGRTFMGCTPQTFVDTAGSCGAVALGINCSLEPRLMYDTAKQVADATKLPLIIKLNAGLPDSAGGSYINPEDFASQMLPYAQIGVKVIGGCCGTTPEHIKALKETFLKNGDA